MLLRSLFMWMLLVLSGLSGCVRVKATERASLSSPAMVSGADFANGSELEAAYRSKLVESKTGGGLPGSAPGGGCGCAQ